MVKEGPVVVGFCARDTIDNPSDRNCVNHDGGKVRSTLERDQLCLPGGNGACHSTKNLGPHGIVGTVQDVAPCVADYPFPGLSPRAQEPVRQLGKRQMTVRSIPLAAFVELASPRETGTGPEVAHCPVTSKLGDRPNRAKSIQNFKRG
mmetsp:Transcript_11934/g.24305  ORF Transcript_11934/g.24305 Transcript_11934/m.24305 type:complete len:148 (+) Transcript_11934:2300-2743(+)